MSLNFQELKDPKHGQQKEDDLCPCEKNCSVGLLIESQYRPVQMRPLLPSRLRPFMLAYSDVRELRRIF